MQEFAKRFYKSKAWQRCRAYVWSRDRGLCVDCMRRGIVTPAEEVHHVKPITPDNINDASITLNPENLISLCRECHKARHGEGERRYHIDGAGRIAPRGTF